MSMMAASWKPSALEMDADGALIAAAQNGTEAECLKLLDAGADANARGKTALQYAASRGLPNLCRELLKRGALVNQADIDGQTALHCAASEGRAAICRLLVEAGADLAARATWTNRDSRYKSVMDVTPLWAIFFKLRDHTDAEGDDSVDNAADEIWGALVETFQVLVELGAPLDAMSIPQVYRADDGGWELDRDDAHVYTPLYFACICEKRHCKVYEQLCRILLDGGAQVDCLGSCDATPLSFAACCGCFATCNMLLERGAKVNNKMNNRDPLSLAAEEGHLEVCELLLERGARVENNRSENHRGCLPLVWAARHGYAKLCDQLLNKNADPNTTYTDQDGAKRSVLHWLTWEQEDVESKIKVANLLLDHGAKYKDALAAATESNEQAFVKAIVLHERFDSMSVPNGVFLRSVMQTLED